MAGRGARDRRQTLARRRERRILAIHRRRNRARPARVRVDHAAADGRALDQAQLGRRLRGQALADRLTGREDERRLAGRDLAVRASADLLKVALDDRAEPDLLHELGVPALGAVDVRRHVRALAGETAVAARELARREVAEEVGQIEEGALLEQLSRHVLLEPEDLIVSDAGEGERTFGSSISRLIVPPTYLRTCEPDALIVAASSTAR